MFFKKNKKLISKDIDPDDIFLDGKPVAGFDEHQLEGRLEKSISKNIINSLKFLFALVILVFLAQTINLQIINGEKNRDKSENNRLNHAVIFSNRGLIYDRNNKLLAWNERNIDTNDFNKRAYIADYSFSNLLGYISYPKKDKSGFYFDTDITGKDGIEYYYDDILGGQNGVKLIEVDALGRVTPGSTIDSPQDGENLILTIDSDIQSKLYQYIEEVANEKGFQGGAGAIMDIVTGDVIALVSYPSYSSAVMSEAKDSKTISAYQNDSRQPFLNRPIAGLFTPGSTMKPFVAIGALNEKIITPERQILSEGKMRVENPYNPDNPSYFSDNKAHGLVDMRRAIAVSSNIYFYQVGGGYGSQKGLGITRLEKYFRMFGFGKSFDGTFFDGPDGVVPNPDWKKKTFDEDWRIGDTYFTSIGQYGTQITLMQQLRAYAAIASGGLLVEPRIIADKEPSNSSQRLDLKEEDFKVVREGMRMTVTDGTTKMLGLPGVKLAVKTGTAELGVSKANVNSWIAGFFPYDNPRYSFAIVMDKGSRDINIGATLAAYRLFDWMRLEKTDYLN